MKINLHSPVEEVQIQILPLLDVIFCILTFFILAALQFTRQQSITVDLPKAASGSTPQIRQMLIVSIDPSGQTYVEQQPVTTPQLAETLRVYQRAYPDGLMVLNASRTSTYNEVVQVLDMMREVGGDRVALSTLPAGAEQVSTPTPTPSTIPTAPLNPLIIPNAIPSAPSQSLSPTIPEQGLNRQETNQTNFGTAPIPTAPAPQPRTTP